MLGFKTSEGSIRLFGSTGGIGTPLSNSNGMAELTGIAPTSGTYTTDQTVTYTALASGDPFAGQFLGIALVGSVGIQVLYDNVRLNIVLPEIYVPEPTTLTIFGLGLAGLGFMRRRRAA